jgi:hypothetical protein
MQPKEEEEDKTRSPMDHLSTRRVSEEALLWIYFMGMPTKKTNYGKPRWPTYGGWAYDPTGQPNC